MARHKATNGNGNGKLTRLGILKMLAYHEQAAASLRFVLEQFDDERTASTLDAALAIDQQRRAGLNGNGNGHALPLLMSAPAKVGKKPRWKAPKAYWNPEVIQARRKRTAANLAKFSKTEPRPVPAGMKGIGSLIGIGYLEKKGDGYIRTDKRFEP